MNTPASLEWPEVLAVPAEPEMDAAPLRQLPDYDDAATLADEKLLTPPAVIDGLLRRGEKAVLGGASKSFKTWASLDLAFCVSHGLPWLGREVTPGRVLVANLELPRWCLRKRILDIAAAHGLRLEHGRLLLWTLRGLHVYAEELRTTILDRLIADLALVVVDPTYKLLNGRDENSAADMASLLNHFEGIAADTGAAVLAPAHYAKGNAAAKESHDRISGSGVFARDPDSILTFTRHETEDAFTVEATLRTFPPVAPFVVHWSHPVFTVDPALDPSKLKQTGGRKPDHLPADLLALLPAGGLDTAAWLAAAESEGISRRTFFRLRKTLLDAEKVLESKATGRWMPIRAKSVA